MSTKNPMNRIALNQNILNKGLIFGQGFQEGDETEAYMWPNGIKVYVNGRNNMSFRNLGRPYLVRPLGIIRHPQAKTGMPGIPAVMRYSLVLLDAHYGIHINFRLDEGEIFESESEEIKAGTNEIIALVKLNEIPEELINDNLLFGISWAMLLLHFHNLFEHHEDISELGDWEIDENILKDIVEYYFENREEIRGVLRLSNS